MIRLLLPSTSCFAVVAKRVSRRHYQYHEMVPSVPILDLMPKQFDLGPCKGYGKGKVVFASYNDERVHNGGLCRQNLPVDESYSISGVSLRGANPAV
jgi:hypothetical protein